MLVVFITAYWCAATDPPGNGPGLRMVEQLHQAKLWVKKKVHATPPLQEGVGDGANCDGGGDTSGDGGGGDTSGDGGENEN